MKVDIEALKRTLEAARTQYPVVGRVLDGKATRDDVAQFAVVARKIGLVDVAEGIEIALADPGALMAALQEAGPELVELFGEGQTALAELGKLETLWKAFRGT